MSQCKRGPLLSISRLTAAAGREDALREAILATVGPALEAPGNLGFVVHVSRDDPRHFLLLEHWTGEQDLDKHMKDAGMLSFLKKTAQMGLIAEGPEASHWTELAGSQFRDGLNDESCRCGPAEVILPE